VAKAEAEFYKPAEACRIAEVAPYVLRYWETEFPVLSEAKDKGAARLYSSRDVKIIGRIRELLYDEGFTVAGAKKRLEAEIAEGRFDDGLKAAPPPADQKKTRPAVPAPPAPAPAPAVARAPVPAKIASPAFLAEPPPPPPAPARAASPAAPEFSERKKVVRELKEIVRLLDRPRKS